MITGKLVGTIDVAEAVLVAFCGFVLALFVYLRREDKREGYPLEDPAGGRSLVGFPLPPPPKTFTLMHGGTAAMPHAEGRRHLALRPLFPFPGTPLVPTGDPLQDGVGPASYAMKKDEPLQTWEEGLQLRPLRCLPKWHVEKGDTDPRGLPVVDADGVKVGRVTDLWLDHGVKILRYLEVTLELPGGVPRAIVPIYFAEVNGRLGEVRVTSLFARHFAAFPQLREADSITAREEDRVSAYCAGGLMYGKPRREESVL